MFEKSSVILVIAGNPVECKVLTNKTTGQRLVKLPNPSGVSSYRPVLDEDANEASFAGIGKGSELIFTYEKVTAQSYLVKFRHKERSYDSVPYFTTSYICLLFSQFTLN